MSAYYLVNSKGYLHIATVSGFGALRLTTCDFSAIQLDFQHPGMMLQQFEATKLELNIIARRLLQLDAQLGSALGKPLTLNPKDFL